jgi:hypothetical protein
MLDGEGQARQLCALHGFDAAEQDGVAVALLQKVWALG